MADETFTKADLDKAVKEAVDKVQEGLDKLEAKNQGLLDDLKKAQREARAAKDIKPEDLAAAEDRAEKALADLAEAQKSVKALTEERDKAVKSLETEQSFTQKLLIQDGLKSALIANGVKDEDYLDMAVSKFSAGAKIVVEGDERKAMYGDKPVADFIKEWAASDAGKKIVAAPANSGGGAQGGKGGGSGKTLSQDQVDAMKPTERAAFFADGGTVPPTA